MFYQWGRKEPFTFATSSEQWGALGNQNGKYSVKIYTIDGVLIYQESNGSSNKDKQPAGGIMIPSTLATSMMETIKNPITYYGYYNTVVVSQVGQTRSLWDYYWTSYSRGTHGVYNNQNLHNNYLDDYNTQRSKSIYDPCPFGFRTPSNGTYNQCTSNIGWTLYSYLGGGVFVINAQSTWLQGLGRNSVTGFTGTGGFGYYSTSSRFKSTSAYTFEIQSGGLTFLNHDISNSYVMSVRCIERVAKNCLKTVQKS